MSQVILKESIRKLGKIGDVVSVKDGYAFNYLIPKGKAVSATKQNLDILESQKAAMLQEDAKKREIAKQLLEKLPREIFLVRAINENGVLYGTISAKDIIEAVPQITNKHAVHFKGLIHSYGVYTIELELHHDVIHVLSVSIADTVDNAKKQLQDSKTKKEFKKTQNKAPQQDTIAEELESAVDFQKSDDSTL